MDYAREFRSIDEGDRRAADVLEPMFADIQRRLDRAETVAAGAALLQEQLIAQGQAIVDQATAPLLAKLRAAADLGVIFSATSATAVAIGPGAKIFVVAEADRAAFAPAAMLTVTAVDAPSASMFGRKLIYDRETGELAIDVLSADGAGTYAAWTITAGSRVAGASQVAAAPPPGFSGGTAQALFAEMAGALGDRADFSEVVEAALGDRYTKLQVNHLLTERAEASDALSALGALGPAAARIPAFASEAEATLLPYGATGRGLLAAETAAQAKATIELAASLYPLAKRDQFGLLDLPGDGSNQHAAMAAEVAAFTALNTTDFNAQAAQPTARPFRTPKGRIVTDPPIAVRTPGVGSVIRGSGASGRWEGGSYILDKNRWDVADIYLAGPPKAEFDKVGVTITGQNQTYGRGDNWYIRDREVGLLSDATTALITLSQIKLEKNEFNLAIIDGNGLQITGGDAAAATVCSFFWFNAQGVRMMNFRNAGDSWFVGGGSAKFVECYLCQVSLTGFTKRFLPQLAVELAADGVSARLVVATKMDVTFQPWSSIFANGHRRRQAEARIRLTAGTSGQIDQVFVDGVPLLAAPVANNGVLKQTAIELAAAITANPATPYTAVADGLTVHVRAPRSDGAAANGRTISVTASGGLTATTPSFVALVCDRPHGVQLNDYLEFKNAAGTTYDGAWPARAIPNPNTIVSEAPYIVGLAGKAWIPHLLIPEDSSPAI